MNSHEYWEEVRSIAANLVEEAMIDSSNDREGAEEEIQDRYLHETIDGHQWVIFNSYNLDVIKHTDNQDYMVDNIGTEELEIALKQGGINQLHTTLAFWSLYADVQDQLGDAMDEYILSLEQEQLDDE